MGEFVRDNHFVPQSYLRRWAQDGNKVWARRLLVPHANVPHWSPHSIAGIAKAKNLYTMASKKSGESDGGLLFRPRVLECFQRHVKTDFVTMLETVGDGLGHAVNPQFNLIAIKYLNAFGIRFACKLGHLDRRVVDLGRMTAARHGDSDLARQLRGQFMELQGAKQAKHRLRHLGGDGSQALMLGARTVGEPVDATASFFQLTIGCHAGQHYPGSPDVIQIARAQHPLLPQQIKNALGMGFMRHGSSSMFHFFVE
jgi:hypothetical protein